MYYVETDFYHDNKGTYSTTEKRRTVNGPFADRQEALAFARSAVRSGVHINITIKNVEHTEV